MYDLKPEAKAFLQRLKEETNDAHISLEANELSQKLMSPDLTVADYAAYLNKMYSLHKALEEQVFPSLRSHFEDLELRKKAHLIEQDLKALDTTPQSSFNEDISFAETEAGALGMMYVMEGSALGGKVILKQLQKTLPEQAIKNATNYFSVYGDKIGGMWMRFLTTFSDTVLSKKSEDSVIDGADKSFALVKNWFDK